MRKLGIYVQVPFCQTKCTYCNFHTGVVAKVRFAPYVEAVCREIKQHRQLLIAAGVDWPGRLERRGASPFKGSGGVGAGGNQPREFWSAIVFRPGIGGGREGAPEGGCLPRGTDFA